MRIPLDGAPESRLVTISAAGGGSAESLRDGRSLLWGAALLPSGAAVLRVWIDGSGKVATVALESRDGTRSYRQRPSPDGRAIAFIDRNTGEIYVQLLSGGGALQVSEIPGRVMRPVVWGADSRSVFYEGANGLNIIELETAPTLRVVRRRVKPNFPIGASFDLSPDGKTFISSDPGRTSVDTWVAVNWIDQARRAWSGK